MGARAKVGMAGPASARAGKLIAQRRHTSFLAFAVALLALAVSALAPTAASAVEAPAKLWKKGENCGVEAASGKCGWSAGETEAGEKYVELQIPRGVASDPATGNLYIADQDNQRIVELSAWGEFVKAWGWGVQDGKAELETCTAESGCDRGIGGSGAGQLSTPQGVAVDSEGNVYVVDFGNHRVQKFDPAGHFLLTFGGGVITGGATGTGTVTSGQTSVTSVLTTSKAFEAGQTITGTGIEAGTKIAAVTAGTIILSKAAGPAATGTTTALTVAEGAGNVPTNEKQTLTLGEKTTGGSFALTFTTPDPSKTSAEATAIPASASASELEAKLSGLANIGAGNVEVSGPAGGPWTIEFKGARFADTDVAQITPDPSGLTVSSGEKSATVATAVQGASAGEVCSIAADCRAGIEGTTSAGQFGSWPFSSFIAVGPADQVYVGDKDRIQRFDTEGAYQAQIPLPEEGDVGSLAVDPNTGDLYFAYPPGDKQGKGNVKQPNVFRLDPTTGKVLDTLEVERPSALATDPEGNVFVFERALFTGDSNSPDNHLGRLLEFNSSGNQVALFAEKDFGVSVNGPSSTGIATGSACLSKGADVYVTYPEQINSFASAYGPPPDKSELCPAPPRAPTIVSEYAISADSHDATLGARVNPHFWADTAYYVEYGEAPCSEGGCASQPAAPGSKLGAGVIDEPAPTAGVFLSGLEPATTYHYRFVAASGGGGPVFGTDHVFHTPPLPLNDTECPNQALRGGSSASLPDCRAYEMVSPLEKEGGDIEVAQGAIDLGR